MSDRQNAIHPIPSWTTTTVLFRLPWKRHHSSSSSNSSGGIVFQVVRLVSQQSPRSNQLRIRTGFSSSPLLSLNNQVGQWCLIWCRITLYHTQLRSIITVSHQIARRAAIKMPVGRRGGKGCWHLCVTPYWNRGEIACILGHILSQKLITVAYSSGTTIKRIASFTIARLNPFESLSASSPSWTRKKFFKWHS